MEDLLSAYLYSSGQRTVWAVLDKDARLRWF